MTLSFSTQFPWGERTNFVEKIISGLNDKQRALLVPDLDALIKREYTFDTYVYANGGSKIHTIRRDESNRWDRGTLIHPVINNRTKLRYQFAPAFPCTNTQKISILVGDSARQKIDLTDDDDKVFTEIIDGYSEEYLVLVDGRRLTYKEAMLLSFNYGFNSLSDFCRWFDKDFHGKIIHWTDYKY